LLAVAVLALVGCGKTDPELRLEGVAQVRVDKLGVVAGPLPSLSDGSNPEGLVWSVSSQEVARVDGDQIIASAPGTATVTGEWHGQSVSWKLEVTHEVALHFHDPPAALAVGQSVLLEVDVQGLPLHPQLEWSTSDPAILEVDPEGRVTGRGSGVAYITASGPGGEAVVELTVR